MKKKIFYASIFALSLLAVSCSDFLVEDPKGKLTPETWFTSQEQLDMSVYAMMAKIQDFQADSNPMIVQCQGDDMTSTTGGNKAAYLAADAFEAPSDAKGLEQNWSNLYAIIKEANTILAGADGTPTTAEEINIAKGQAYYWRAFSYFSLVRLFGPLPMNLENTPDNNETELTPVAEVYAQIEADLNAAEACDLPTQYSETNRAVNGANLYVSYQTVKATQAAVYLAEAGYPLNNSAKYAEAATAAKAALDVSANSPLTDWAQMYSYGNNHHKETLLGIDYRDYLGGWGSYDSQFSSCHQSGKLWSGWGDFLAERYYWSTYPDGPRKDATYAKQICLSDETYADWWATTDEQPYDGTNAYVPDYRPMFIAFSVNQDESGSPIAAPFDYRLPTWGGMCINKRHHLIRYGEVLCWYAEALARSGGDLSAARSALQTVVDRAYNSDNKPNLAAMSADELAEQAYLEHGYEVAGFAYALVTRRHDQFRMERLKEGYDYRAGSQSAVLVPAGTLTTVYNADGSVKHQYNLKYDVVCSEEMEVTAAWDGENSIYMNYPPTEVEKNPKLTR